MNWSVKQLAVFEDVANGEGHTMVDAVAGSGKTTTILEAMKSVPEGCSVLFVAFNKSIATELAKRAPAGVDVSTLHALGLKACARALGRPRIDGDKAKEIARAVTGAEQDFSRREWCQSVIKAVSLSKSCLAATAEEIDRHGHRPVRALPA